MKPFSLILVLWACFALNAVPAEEHPVRQFHRRMFGVVVTSTLEERQSWLAEARRTVTGCFRAADQRIESV
jgi:hypothetical protein